MIESLRTALWLRFRLNHPYQISRTLLVLSLQQVQLNLLAAFERAPDF